MTVPVGENGKPLVKISMSASELLPTAQYANVTIGPAVVERYVEDEPQTVREALDHAAELVESVIAEEREKVIASLQDS